MYVKPYLQGRLGNNLFQIATAYCYAKRTNQVFVTPKWDYDHYFPNLMIQERNKNLDVILDEKDYYYHELPERRNVMLRGYFQSEKYFDSSVKNLLRTNTERLMADKHKDKIYNSVSVHVRRGDYVGSQHYVNLWTTDYYHKALDMFNEADNYLIFSDGIEYCKMFFGEDSRFHYIDNQNAVEDMALMSLCDRHIIANSSFSWWGAWLGGGQTIAPARWFGKKKQLTTRDLIPERWISL